MTTTLAKLPSDMKRLLNSFLSPADKLIMKGVTTLQDTKNKKTALDEMKDILFCKERYGDIMTLTRDSIRVFLHAHHINEEFDLGTGDIFELEVEENYADMREYEEQNIQDGIPTERFEERLTECFEKAEEDTPRVWEAIVRLKRTLSRCNVIQKFCDGFLEALWEQATTRYITEFEKTGFNTFTLHSWYKIADEDKPQYDGGILYLLDMAYLHHTE